MNISEQQAALHPNLIRPTEYEVAMRYVLREGQRDAVIDQIRQNRADVREVVAYLEQHGDTRVEEIYALLSVDGADESAISEAATTMRRVAPLIGPPIYTWWDMKSNQAYYSLTPPEVSYS